MRVARKERETVVFTSNQVDIIVMVVSWWYLEGVMVVS